MVFLLEAFLGLLKVGWCAFPVLEKRLWVDAGGVDGHLGGWVNGWGDEVCKEGDE